MGFGKEWFAGAMMTERARPIVEIAQGCKALAENELAGVEEENARAEEPDNQLETLLEDQVKHLYKIEGYAQEILGEIRALRLNRRRVAWIRNGMTTRFPEWDELEEDEEREQQEGR